VDFPEGRRHVAVTCIKFSKSSHMSYGHEVFGLAAVTRPVRLATSSRQCSRLMAISLRELPLRSLAMDTRCGSFLASHEFRSLLGVRGQIVLVDPAAKLVMVHTAVRQMSSDRAANAETIALWLVVVARLGQ
jgi:hypothetical protein